MIIPQLQTTLNAKRNPSNINLFYYYHRLERETMNNMSNFFQITQFIAFIPARYFLNISVEISYWLGVSYPKVVHHSLTSCPAHDGFYYYSPHSRKVCLSSNIFLQITMYIFPFQPKRRVLSSFNPSLTSADVTILFSCFHKITAIYEFFNSLCTFYWLTMN